MAALGQAAMPRRSTLCRLTVQVGAQVAALAWPALNVACSCTLAGAWHMALGARCLVQACVHLGATLKAGQASAATCACACPRLRSLHAAAVPCRRLCAGVQPLLACHCLSICARRHHPASTGSAARLGGRSVAAQAHKLLRAAASLQATVAGYAPKCRYVSASRCSYYWPSQRASDLTACWQTHTST